MVTREKAVTTKAESNGRKLPGRVVLLGLVAFVVIFLDFESNSLADYGANPDATTFYDSHQVAVASPGTTSQSHAADDLGRIQRHQLQQQWLEYTQRINGTDTQLTGPETIVSDSEPHQIYIHHNQSTNSSMQYSASDAATLPNFAHVNVSIEEIVTIDEFNVTKVDPQHFSAPFFGVNDTEMLDNSTIVSIEELISLEKSSQCFPYNSNAWLDGKRLSNADSNLTDSFVFKQIQIPNPLDSEWFSHISSQTICHAESRFRNLTLSVNWNVTNEKLIDEWEFRLLYMAIHHHQHAPAFLEVQARQACPYEEPQVAKMDFECPSSKFLVSNVAPSELGISIRRGAVNTILMGLATNRIAMFINNVHGGASFFEAPFSLAECPRGDLQCVFLPSTPCTLLLDDLKNVTILPKTGVHDFELRGRIRSPEYAEPRVLAMESMLSPLDEASLRAIIENRLHAIALQLIDGIRKSAQPEHILVLEAAAARIKMDGGTTRARDGGINYHNTSTHLRGNRKAAHAALMYLMRPNAMYQQLSDEIVEHSIPKDLDRSLSIGLPISVGSENCIGNGQCHEFDTYMKLARRLWDDQGTPSGNKGALFLTTDDTSVMEARHAYEHNQSFPFRFIVMNDNVTLQDSKHLRHDDDDKDLTSPRSLLKSIASIKMQLETKLLIGNCCSFTAAEAVGQHHGRFEHLALLDLFREGCGMVPNGQIMCLQEHPDPEFHLNCPSLDGAVG